MDIVNDYTREELEGILGIKIDSADTCCRGLGSTDAKLEEKDKFLVDSVVEFTLNMPLNKAYLLLPYNEKVSINQKIFHEVIDKMFDNVQEHMHYIENTIQGYPHLHGYIRFRFDHPIVAGGLLMDVAKIVLMNLTRGQYNRQYARSNYNELLRRYKCPALCLNYKNLLGDKWLSYIRKNAVRSDENK